MLMIEIDPLEKNANLEVIRILFLDKIIAVQKDKQNLTQ
jgi:hypothetical protein